MVGQFEAVRIWNIPLTAAEAQKVAGGDGTCTAPAD
jgi:hypothetical protein